MIKKMLDLPQNLRAQKRQLESARARSKINKTMGKARYDLFRFNFSLGRFQ